MDRAQEILTRWIDSARSRGIKDRLITLWMIKDIVDNKTWVTQESVIWSLKYLRAMDAKTDQAKADRDHLAEIVKARGGDPVEPEAVEEDMGIF